MVYETIYLFFQDLLIFLKGGKEKRKEKIPGMICTIFFPFFSFVTFFSFFKLFNCYCFLWLRDN